MNRYLTPCVDSNQIKDLNVRCESMKLLKKTQGRFHSLALDGDSVAVAVPPKHKQPRRKGTNAVTANQTASAQEEQMMSERQPPDRGKNICKPQSCEEVDTQDHAFLTTQ